MGGADDTSDLEGGRSARDGERAAAKAGDDDATDPGKAAADAADDEGGAKGAKGADDATAAAKATPAGDDGDDDARAKARARARQEAIERVLADESGAGKHARGRRARGDDERARDDDERAPRRRPAGRLADALGIEADDRPPSKWRRRFIYLLVIGAVALVTWVLSVRNHGRFYLVCFADRVEPQRGSQWPWGRELIGGEAHAAVKVPPEVDCRERTFDSEDALDQALADLLLARIEADVRSGTTKLDEATARLTQAQLLTRGRPAARARLQQLGADLAYLRGRQGVEQAAAALKAAITQFRDAKARGATVGRDAEQWIEHLQRLLPRLESPREAAPPPASTPTLVPPRTAPPLPPAPARDGGVAVPPPGGVLL